MRSALKLGDAETAELLRQQLRTATGQLRYLLQEDRKHHVDALLAQVDNAEPSQLFAQLRRLGIGAASKKYSNKALPMMKMRDGTSATSYQESQMAWQQHASSLEGGCELQGDQLLQQCDERQRQHQEVAAVPYACNIPTKTQLERACRKLRPFKARGPDGLPAGPLPPLSGIDGKSDSPSHGENGLLYLRTFRVQRRKVGSSLQGKGTTG